MDPTTTVLKLSGFPPAVKNVPALWTQNPQQGKISLLWNANYRDIYHKYSPFTNFEDNMLSVVLSDKQPFLYTYIDEADQSMFNQIPKGVRALADSVGWNQDSINDVVRVSKFMISSWGVQFIGKQFALQRLNAFDETRLYNPLSPVLATVQPLTLGIGQPPLRHIEGGILGGLANSVTSVVGINLQSSYRKPDSTADGDGALPTINQGQGKGMIRGKTASGGLTTFQSKWAPKTTSSDFSLSSALTTFGKSVKDSFVSFFGSPTKSPGLFRADEEGYFIMAGGRTSYQPWFAPKTKTTSGPPASNKSVLGVISGLSTAVTNVITNPVGTLGGAAMSGLFPSTIGGAATVTRYKLISKPDKFEQVPFTTQVKGLSVANSSTGYSLDENKKYGDVIGQTADGSFTNSDMLVQYSWYADVNQKYPTKLNDPTSDKVKKINDTLQKVIDNLNTQGGNYNATTTTVSNLLPPGNRLSVGYDKITNQSDPQRSPKTTGVIGEYVYGSGGRGFRPKSIDAFVRPSPDNLRMSTTFMSDGINMLGVLPKNRSTVNGDGTFTALNSVYGKWTVWEPEEDDLVAFYFYDVVNEKYIPFRATVKAISEGNTAFWDELRFIGRADQLYSYNGFSRTLSFTFNIVVNSVTELLPCWKKINYMASSVKPSNYTAGYLINDSFNRFIVPPMFMLTIGDLYKYQPIVITSINVNIPDDAIWETLNENNAKQGWSYLNGTITAPTLGKNYGQLPREVEIAVTCNILEKERAIVGGSHFGHEPRIDNWERLDVNDPSIFLTSDEPYLPKVTELHRKFVEWNTPSLPNPATPNGSVTQARVNQSAPQSLPSQAPFTLLSAPPQGFTQPYQLPTTTGINMGQMPISNVRINNVAPVFNPGNPISTTK